MVRRGLLKDARFNAIRGTHWVLRAVNMAPDQMRARRIGSSAHHHGPSVVEASKKSILFLTPRSWAAHVHWEATIATALRMRGATVNFITCGGGLERCDRETTHESPPMPCHSCTRYTNKTLAFYGFEPTPMSFRESQTWPELDTLGLDELTTVDYRGVPIGRLVEIPVKWFLLNTQLVPDPLGLLTYRAFLRSARNAVDEMYLHLEQRRPDVLVLLNGLFFFESIAWHIARELDIDVVNYERGYVIDTLLFDRGEPACFGFVDDVWPQFAATPLSDDEKRELNAYLGDRQLGRRAIEEYWRQIDPGLRFKNPSRRLTTLFTNLTWDSAVINKEVAFDSIHSWIASTVEYFQRHPEHDLVIRIHPAEVRLSGKPTREPVAKIISQQFPQLPANVRLIHAEDPASSYALMAESDLVTVLTSTTGLEAALAGVPVVVSGQTAYRGKGFTLDVGDERDYWDTLDRVLSDPIAHSPEQDLVQRYAHLFFFKLPVRFDLVKEHVRGVVRIDYRQARVLSPGNSSPIDRICDGILNGGRFRP